MEDAVFGSSVKVSKRRVLAVGRGFTPDPSRTHLCIRRVRALVAWMTPSSGHP